MGSEGGSPAARNASTRLGLMAVAPRQRREVCGCGSTARILRLRARDVADVVRQRLGQKAFAVVRHNDRRRRSPMTPSSRRMARLGLRGGKGSLRSRSTRTTC